MLPQATGLKALYWRRVIVPPQELQQPQPVNRPNAPALAKLLNAARLAMASVMEGSSFFMAGWGSRVSERRVPSTIQVGESVPGPPEIYPRLCRRVGICSSFFAGGCVVPPHTRQIEIECCDLTGLPDFFGKIADRFELIQDVVASASRSGGAIAPRCHFSTAMAAMAALSVQRPAAG